MKDSQFRLRVLAAGLYGIAGCDATPEQISGARKALKWYQEGKSVSLIRLLLRIKTAAPAPEPATFEAISLHSA